MSSWWKDQDLQEHLLSFICKDRLFLKKFGSLLTPRDFRPGRDESDERHIVATLGLEFWEKYREPIGGLLRINVLAHCREKNVGDKKKKLLIELVDKIVKNEKLVAVAALEDKVQEYLKQKAMKGTLEDLVLQQEKGKLSPDSFLDAAKVVGNYSGRRRRQSTEYHSSKELEARIARRAFQATQKRPLILIDDLDAKTKMIGRGDVGLVVGLYGKGKSMLLAHIGDAYAKQRYKVLYITLEDPREEVEDRMDASLAYLPIDRLDELPKKLRKRFKRFSRLIGGRIKIVDGTEGGVTVAEIEEIWERERDSGFTADVVIVDYDKEIRPRGKYRERRFEFEEIYTDLRQFASRKQVFLWTAAQAKRLKESQKIISGDNIGEDIGKMQKCTMMIGIGQGEHHQWARYYFIAKNKRGRGQFGVEVMSNPERGLAYDRDSTFDLKRAIKASRHTK